MGEVEGWVVGDSCGNLRMERSNDIRHKVNERRCQKEKEWWRCNR